MLWQHRGSDLNRYGDRKKRTSRQVVTKLKNPKYRKKAFNLLDDCLVALDGCACDFVDFGRYLFDQLRGKSRPHQRRRNGKFRLFFMGEIGSLGESASQAMHLAYPRVGSIQLIEVRRRTMRVNITGSGAVAGI